MFLNQEIQEAVFVCGMFQKDLHGKYVFCDLAYAKNFGFNSTDDVLGKADSDLFSQDVFEKIFHCDSIVKTKKQEAEIRFSCKINDENKHLILKQAPIMDNDNNVNGISGFCLKCVSKKTNDVDCLSKEKQKNQKIKEYYENLISLLPGNVYWMSRENEFLGCNNNQAKLAGLQSRHEIVGKKNIEMPWKDQAEAIDAINIQVMDTGKPIVEEEEAEMFCDGELKKGLYLSHKIPLFDDNEKVIGLLGVSIDVTERKKAEQLAVEHKILQEKLKVQEASNKYIGTLAHELRTPLSSFKVILNLIEMNDENNSENPDERRRNLKMFTVKGDQVEKAGLSFIEMILYKIRSMTNKLDREKFQFCLIRDEVTDVLDKYPFNAGERELVSFDQSNGFIYKGDRVATSHILFNLIKNTLKIIHEEDRGKITIRFDKSDEKYNKLIFEDDAKGVDPKFLPYMFDSFVYKDSTGKGTGLGLAYCKMVMEDYDGDIICESELGKYTRFTCLFPKVDMSEFDDFA